VVAITAGAGWGIERLGDAPSLARLTPDQGDDGKRIVSVLRPALASAIGAEGLGAACVAGPDLLDIHASARHPSFESGRAVPEGSIVVECLIAAARVGLGSLTRERLAAVYRQSGTAHASPEGFDRGLRWALTPLYGEVSLVLGPDDAFRAFPTWPRTPRRSARTATARSRPSLRRSTSTTSSPWPPARTSASTWSARRGCTSWCFHAA